MHEEETWAVQKEKKKIKKKKREKRKKKNIQNPPTFLSLKGSKGQLKFTNLFLTSGLLKTRRLDNHELKEISVMVNKINEKKWFTLLLAVPWATCNDMFWLSVLVLGYNTTHQQPILRYPFPGIFAVLFFYFWVCCYYYAMLYVFPCTEWQSKTLKILDWIAIQN